uniref:Uncharacterized protein n=1 Tax=Anguilla anguilla TaxID=7936 RepID=A0A0E9XN25_ANGAN
MTGSVGKLPVTVLSYLYFCLTRVLEIYCIYFKLISCVNLLGTYFV